MRLAIADPPYPPRISDRADLAGGRRRSTSRSRARRWYGDQAAPRTAADFHSAAAEWDDPARHRALLEQLEDEYDGWALATTLDGAAFYGDLPAGARHMVWHKTRAMPNGSHIASSCELVIVYTPHGRRRIAAGSQVPDLLTCAPPGAGFAGAKPPAWTRWVLDALRFDPDVDELHDLFPGSGAVAAAAAQGVLL